MLLNKLSKVLVTRQVNTRSIFSAKILGQDHGSINHSDHRQDKNITINQDQFEEEQNYVTEDPKDRSEKIDVETSIRYIRSKAFKESYGDNLIWTLYRRNYTRHIPGDTRKTCIRQNKITTGSPCPICRDKYLVLDYRNVDLLKQFISPYSGAILPSRKTGLCQKQQQNLIIAVLNAKDYGTISFYVPFRHFDYNYYKELCKNVNKNE